MATLNEQTAVLERHIANGTPLYLLASNGCSVAASTVHPGLGKHLFAHAFSVASLRTANSDAPEPLFDEWYPRLVEEGVLPVPVHMLMSACEYREEVVNKHSRAYHALGDALYCEHYPHLNPWTKKGYAKLLAIKEQLLSEGHVPPDLSAAFAADPDPAASLTERRTRRQAARTGVQSLSDGALRDGPVLVNPAEAGITG